MKWTKNEGKGEGRMGMEEQKEDKQQLRKRMLDKRAQITEEEQERRSLAIVERLLELPDIQTASRIFTFLSFGHEVNLDAFVTACMNGRKEVYVPKTYIKEKKMIPYRLSGLRDLHVGGYGIREPDEQKCEVWQGEPFDVVIVPGVAFTSQGERLGYGGGFYDRFFSQFTQLPTLIAACYDMQFVPSIPTEAHDYRMDKIVTEKEVIVCSSF
jgi:5-formyltetrahydrofolate cyclo-ligase